MKQIINHGIAGVGFVFYLSAKDVEQQNGIVVEVPTENHPLFFGNDPADWESQVTAVICTKSHITIVRGTDDKQLIPTKLAGGRPIRIYEYGQYPKSFWTWENNSGETLMKYWATRIGDDKPSLENVIFFVDEYQPIWVGYAAMSGDEEEVAAETAHLRKIIYG